MAKYVSSFTNDVLNKYYFRKNYILLSEVYERLKLLADQPAALKVSGNGAPANVE